MTLDTETLAHQLVLRCNSCPEDSLSFERCTGSATVLAYAQLSDDQGQAVAQIPIILTWTEAIRLARWILEGAPS